jgi:hypothetical protein
VAVNHREISRSLKMVTDVRMVLYVTLFLILEIVSKFKMPKKMYFVSCYYNYVILDSFQFSR